MFRIDKRYPSPIKWHSNAADFGLLYFNARWMDPALGRFAQADTIVPAGVQGYDRYAFVNNNPVRYVDPSGHMRIDGGTGGSAYTPKPHSLPKLKPTNDGLENIVGLDSNSSFACTIYACTVNNPSVCPLGQICWLSTSPQPNTQSSETQAIAEGLKLESKALDLVLAMESAADIGKPYYKTLKGVVPLTGIEMGISASLQFISDMGSELTVPQRLLRPVAVALEAGLTDIGYDAFGVAGFSVGGPGGFVTASFAANLTIDNNFENFNSWAFPAAGLGVYP